MKKCPQCDEPITDNNVVCPNCGRLLLPANQLNLFVSLSVVSVAIIATLLYWVLSELIWLPLAQTGLGIAIDTFKLQNHVPYWSGLIERRGFFNANWLLFGAFLYIPIITIVTMRLGLRRAVVAALASPAPFAVMDIWSWWVRAVDIPGNVDRTGALLPLPGLLQFVAVFAISAVVVTPFYFLFTIMGRFLPKRITTAFLIQPIGTTVMNLPQPISASLSRKPVELPTPMPVLETISTPEPQPIIAEIKPAASIVAPEPLPEPEPPAPIVEVESKPPVRAATPSPVIPLPVEPEPALTASASEDVFDALAPTQSAPKRGLLTRIIIAGLAVVAIIGTILIIFALRA